MFVYQHTNCRNPIADKFLSLYVACNPITVISRIKISVREWVFPDNQTLFINSLQIQLITKHTDALYVRTV